ncbi:hypothetical protein [Haloarcula pellucida]|uniref:Uncharacterized protein n=1 Tax=Haloarcula pellucida TaxID=1427151 RepID=A0A830GJB3_9EURY|nr:hypothetical protein [Halomicroarcula pellucida]MBX0347676.1 hypothetical protein [Halomicroarcula pellucida]GGN89823.1 hypothetical protein GCM10009030_11020 [Halomicroarcula pellucida]
MTIITRRHAIASSLALVSGCITRENGNTQPSHTTTSNGNEQKSYRDGSESNTKSQASELDLLDPTITFEYGDSFNNGGLEITVGEPDIRTSVEIKERGPSKKRTPTAHNSKSVESSSTDSVTEKETTFQRIKLPEGRAVVLVPIQFHNTNTNQDVRISAPNVALTTDGKKYIEDQTINSPDIADPVSSYDIKGFSDLLGRWTMHGTKIEASERVEDVAMIEIPAGITAGEYNIVFHPYLSGFGDQYYESRTAAWTKSVDDTTDAVSK